MSNKSSYEKDLNLKWSKLRETYYRKKQLSKLKQHELPDALSKELLFKGVRVHAPIPCIKLVIPIYFIDHSEFITVQCKKILSRANNEIKCFEFSSIKRA